VIGGVVRIARNRSTNRGPGHLRAAYALQQKLREYQNRLPGLAAAFEPASTSCRQTPTAANTPASGAHHRPDRRPVHHFRQLRLKTSRRRTRSSGSEIAPHEPSTSTRHDLRAERQHAGARLRKPVRLAHRRRLLRRTKPTRNSCVPVSIVAEVAEPGGWRYRPAALRVVEATAGIRGAGVTMPFCSCLNTGDGECGGPVGEERSRMPGVLGEAHHARRQ
jgi:hypothetical protein